MAAELMGVAFRGPLEVARMSVDRAEAVYPAEGSTGDRSLAG